MSNQSDPVVIVSAARTPMGSFQSDFASLAAHDLGGVAIKAAVERAGIKPELVTEVLFGNCLMAGRVKRLRVKRHSKVVCLKVLAR